MKKTITIILIILMLPVITIFVACEDSSEQTLRLHWFLMTNTEMATAESESWEFYQFLEHSELEREFAESIEFNSQNGYSHEFTIHFILLKLDSEEVFSRRVTRVSLGIRNNVEVSAGIQGEYASILFPRDISNPIIDEVITITTSGYFLRALFSPIELPLTDYYENRFIELEISYHVLRQSPSEEGD